MANFCLVPQVAEKFKQEILSGEVDPAKLAVMTSAERRAFFAEHLGESNAEPVNALFESKLLLKNQQAGMINWARRVMGTNKATLQDMVSKINRLDKVLNPSEQEAFLEDLAAQKLGTHISYEEAQKISDLSRKVQQTKGVGDRMDYGRAVVDLHDYVGKLKNEAKGITLQDLKSPSQYGKILSNVGSKIAGTAKSLKASLDDSAIFRQGWKTMFTNPDVWAKNAAESFVNLTKSFGKTDVMREINADIMSRPTYDLMKKAKLAVGLSEEAFPETLPEKIPLFGRIYKASEVAYNGFVQKTRADVFDKYIQIAKESGVELDDEQLLSIGKLVNSLTGRGYLGKLEGSADVVNNVFFSPRFLKSNIDTLTAHQLQKGVTPFVRKQAAFNLIKIILGTASVLGIAKAIKKDSVELDPRSSDFGKIKIGNTRFDVSAGMGSIVTLASRLAPLLAFHPSYTKSTVTGQLTPLNSGKFGAKTGMDVLNDFLENKLSPVASVIKDLLKGTDSNSKPVTPTGELNNFSTPLPITNAMELLKDPNSANFFISIIADGFGIATNTYAPPVKTSKRKK